MGDIRLGLTTMSLADTVEISWPRKLSPFIGVSQRLAIARVGRKPPLVYREILTGRLLHAVKQQQLADTHRYSLWSNVPLLTHLYCAHNSGKLKVRVIFHPSTAVLVLGSTVKVRPDKMEVSA
jgi:hypothetical protein